MKRQESNPNGIQDGYDSGRVSPSGPTYIALPFDGQMRSGPLGSPSTISSGLDDEYEGQTRRQSVISFSESTAQCH